MQPHRVPASSRPAAQGSAIEIPDDSRVRWTTTGFGFLLPVGENWHRNRSTWWRCAKSWKVAHAIVIYEGSITPFAMQNLQEISKQPDSGLSRVETFTFNDLQINQLITFSCRSNCLLSSKATTAKAGGTESDAYGSSANASNRRDCTILRRAPRVSLVLIERAPKE